MDKKAIRTKHFSFKELRLSIAYMVLWSLLAIAFFTYLAIEIGEAFGRNPLYFVLVVAGYVIIVLVLTLVFTYRFIGPFERLKTELRVIQSGEYHRRLCIRTRDDIYLKSFIQEVDKILDTLEKAIYFKKELYNDINSELSRIKTLTEKEDISQEELKEKISLSYKKIRSVLKNKSDLNTGRQNV